ncbi:histidine phosphatase family protein [Arthrobacter bambusae]|uniref:histidine phosphatase family protein n=1 Tax=Arthrobacter bambusae TaxID=1338426 RepID=UPI001F50FE51|nr:histidine phosphatase family protein [Arthrobacter bambusae]MCI0144237.1 histidine phosphatase family protein [Arthrobacter bambusae]
MKSALVLVRHGQTRWNAELRIQGSTDIPLNETGRLQALETATSLKDRQWDILACSPLIRAFETAQIIQRELGLPPPIRIPGLVERDYGEAEGRSAFGLSKKEISHLVSLGEPETAVAARGISALKDLLGEYPTHRIIVVAHATLIRLTLSALLNHPQPKAQNGQTIDVDPAFLKGPELRGN